MPRDPARLSAISTRGFSQKAKEWPRVAVFELRAAGSIEPVRSQHRFCGNRSRTPGSAELQLGPNHHQAVCPGNRVNGYRHPAALMQT
ncbi:MAG: hypothetical protein H0X45_03350 [Planctomycetes bacterium]|nr:hypothetical protein [Planctomycetota bacterium]